MLLNESYNKNESKEHYELKQIAKYILYHKGYNCIATEVQFSKYCTYLKNYNWFKPKASSKNIIDVIGVKGGLLNIRKNTVDDYKVLGIESKASYADFLNGFCCQCEYTYIIAPLGIIPVDKIPDKIGLIEVDLENYSIDIRRGKFEFTGIYTTKQCSSRKKDLYSRTDTFRVDTFNILKKIAYRSTINDIFKNNEIEVRGCKNTKSKGE
jgi:hypothetical protein